MTCHTPPLSAWPPALRRAVVVAWRELAGRGASYAKCLRLCAKVYVVAGGSVADAEGEVRRIIAAYTRDEADWLWGPALRTAERRRCFSFAPPDRAPLLS